MSTHATAWDRLRRDAADAGYGVCLGLDERRGMSLLVEEDGRPVLQLAALPNEDAPTFLARARARLLRLRSRRLAVSALELLGLALVGVGLALVSIALALVVLGALLLAAVVWGAIR